MALIFMDSFDHYDTADITEKYTQLGGQNGGSDSTAMGAYGRHSSNGVRLQFNSGGGAWGKSLRKVLTTMSGDTCVVGLALFPVSAHTILDPNNERFFTLYSSAVQQIAFRLNTNGTISAALGSTVIATTATALSEGVYTYVEIKVLIHNSAGTIEIRFNGDTTPILTYAGDTQNAAAATWNEFEIGPLAGNTEWWLDDLYLLDGTGAAPWNTFLGDCRVDARRPTAAGATTAWTPSTGANWQNVDDAMPNDDTDYNSAAAAGLTDTFVVEDAPVAGAAIYGIQHCLSVKKTDAGAASIAPVVRHSGTDNVGANLAPGLTYAVWLQIAATNPGTGVAWTEAGFNAAEFGYRRTV